MTSIDGDVVYDTSDDSIMLKHVAVAASERTFTRGQPCVDFAPCETGFIRGNRWSRDRGGSAPGQLASSHTERDGKSDGHDSAQVLPVWSTRLGSERHWQPFAHRGEAPREGDSKPRRRIA